MPRDPRTVYANALLEGADAGAYTLPQEVHDARATLDRQRAEEGAAGAEWEPLSPAAVKERLSDGMVAGMRAGQLPIEDVIAEIDEAERRQRAAAMRVEITRMAVQKADAQLVVIVAETRDETIRAHLRPALDSTLEEVRAVAPTLDGADYQRLESLLGNAAKGKAAIRLIEAAKRHTSIRNAQRLLFGGNIPEPWELATYRNAPEIFKAAGIDWRGRRQVNRKPWPAEPLPYLVWLATDPLPAPWIPTPDEFQALALQVLETTKLRQAPTLIG